MRYFVLNLVVLSLLGCGKKELSFDNKEDKSEVSFTNGTSAGVTTTSSGNLTIDTDSLEGTSLNASWTPKYDNIVGYWKMDGDWLDSSGNGNNGTANDDATFGMPSLLGSSAGVFDGSGDFVTASDFPLPSDATISVWINIDSLGAFQELYANTGLNLSNYIYIAVNASDQVVGFFRDGSSQTLRVTSSKKMLVGIWQHIVVVRSGTKATVYINGEEDNSATNGSIGTIDVSDGNPLHLGATHSGSANYFDGYMDEVAVWSDDLTANEVFSLYEQQRPKFSGELDSSWTPQWNNIVGYWKMDGNWLDSSGNGNHMTANDAASFRSSSQVGSQSGTFDGDSDYASVATASELNPSTAMSVSAWFKLDVVDSNTDFGNVIIMKGDWNVADSYGMYFYSNNLRCALGKYWGDALVYTDTNFTAGQWYHIVCAADSSGHKLYINGIRVASDSDPFGPLSNVRDLRFGAHSTAGAVGDYDGEIDDVAIWGGVALSPSEVSEIYHRQKQKYAGSFISQVFDFGTSGSWLGFDVVTPLPFMKELPGLNGSESSSVYSGLVGSTGSVGDDDLMDGLVGLWHFNESTTDSAPGGSDFEDFSGNASHGNILNTINPGIAKGFGRAISIDESTSAEVSITANSQTRFSAASDFSISIWLFDFDPLYDTLDSRQQFFFVDGDVTDSYLVNFQVMDGGHANSGQVRVAMYNGTSGWGYHLPDRLTTKGSYHMVATKKGNVVTVFINGEPVGTKSDATLDMSGIVVSAIRIGRQTNGIVDEAAIWSRALTSSEILQLYRRGANRLKYQVRSCAQSDCSDGEWKGPGGDGTTYYSELFNRLGSNFNFSCSLNTTDSDSSVCVDDEISFLGSPLVIAPSLLFRDMAGSATLDRNRYFQFKVLMESDDENGLCSGSPCLPELKSLKVRHGP